MPKFHKWLHKGKWQRYSSGTYIYREDICGCGCIRRVVINDAGDEVVESYTLNEETTVAHIPCDRPKKIKKSRRKNSTYQKRKTELNNFCKNEDFIMITIPKKNHEQENK